MLQNVSIKNICDNDDGRISEAFDQAIARVKADLLDRPALGKPRTISLTVRFTPTADVDGNLAHVDMYCDVKEVVPKRESRRYVLTAKRGELQLNDLSPENPNQTTLDEPRLRAAK